VRVSAWDDLTGQDEAIAVFRAAARAVPGAPGSAMTHSWLITGPPGSGRSNLAFAFAAALLGGDGDDPAAAAAAVQVAARTHPDLAVLATERVIITVDEVRALVTASQFSPSVSRYRVMIIEDADRMTERTSNLLLKALEEPPPRTVWILCAPSEADLIPTIRSRVRSVRLRVPGVADVAALLHRRDGIDTALAEQAAREAQSHIGMALRLATDEEARARRRRTLEVALGVGAVSQAVLGAAELLEVATADARAITEQRDSEERAATLRSMGVEPGGTVPAQLRSELKRLEEDQKRRATRSLRDGLDRILVDLMSLYRDILLVQLGVEGDLVNLALVDRLRDAAAATDPARTLATLDAVRLARERIEGNVAPALALEAMLVSAVRRPRAAA
jgi:DNA polymerase III subunit delta'